MMYILMKDDFFKYGKKLLAMHFIYLMLFSFYLLLAFSNSLFLFIVFALIILGLMLITTFFYFKFIALATCNNLFTRGAALLLTTHIKIERVILIKYLTLFFWSIITLFISLLYFYLIELLFLFEVPLLSFIRATIESENSALRILILESIFSSLTYITLFLLVLSFVNTGIFSEHRLIILLVLFIGIYLLYWIIKIIIASISNNLYILNAFDISVGFTCFFLTRYLIKNKLELDTLSFNCLS